VSYKVQAQSRWLSCWSTRETTLLQPSCVLTLQVHCSH